MDNLQSLSNSSRLGSGVNKNDSSSIFKVNSQQLQNLFDRDSDKNTNNTRLSELGGVSGITRMVQSDPHSGIMGDKADLRRRTTKFCKNEKPVPQKPPIWQSIKGGLDFLLVLVAIFAVISIIPGMVVDPAQGWVEGVFILVALFVQVMISACADYKKDKKFVQLQSLNREENLPVTRGKRGQMQTISVWSLVVGDVIQLQPGDKVPADCLVIESANLAVAQPKHVPVDPEDEDRIIPVEFDNKVKKDTSEDPFLIADSFIVRGVCKALVCCVGEQSTRGIKDTPLNLEEQNTELKQKLNNLGGTMKFFAIIASLIILGTSVVIVFINKAASDIESSEFVDRLVNCFIVALIMLIVCVPEGLDMTKDVSLAYSVLQMSNDDNVLVRDLESVEKVGQITDLILGKTGTMTTEEMEVHSFYAQGDSRLNSRKNTFQNCELDREIQTKIIQSIVWNSSAYIEMSENSFYVPEGQGTEVSLIKWLQNAEEPVHEYMKEKFSGIVRATVPFSSVLKKSIIAVQLPEQHGHETVRVFVKGAPEVVVANCAKHFEGRGSNPMKELLSEEARNQINSYAEQMTGIGMRCMAFSYCDMSIEDFENLMNSMSGEIDTPEEIAALEGQEQTFLALIALKDPLRSNIKEVVKNANESGIKLLLVSGDNLLTSAAVASDVGIIEKNDFETIKRRDATPMAMNGEDFAYAVGDVVEQEEQEENEDGEHESTITLKLTNQDAFNSIIQGGLKVVGRADPETKRRLIVGLKGMNENRRVAVIGEGINDIKAFAAADVSFALQSGTSIARNKASMILRTDDFDSAMKAVMWGRNIFMNVQRFLQFQITCNLSVLILVLVSYILKQETVLNPVQLIYINLIMDILGALALASTRPTEEIKTYAAGQGNIMRPEMYRQIFGGMLGMVGIMMVMLLANETVFNLSYLNSDSTIENKDKMAGFTLIFNTFIFLQIFNLINCRDISATKKHGFAGLHKNFLTWLILLILVGVQILACFTFLGVPIFETSVYAEDRVGREDESGRHFAITVVSASSILLVNALLKLIPQRWIAKMPQLDESKSVGANSGLVSMYDKSAKRQVGVKQAASHEQVAQEENESILNDGEYSDMQSREREDGFDKVA